ncbi:hypothetical protein [Microbispora sp. NPDC049125]|uniref:hypothetical protein n=1 Tax=Microbispora sp. NPDC049125 TaxID=3154929 RepID=UPI003465B352
MRTEQDLAAALRHAADNACEPVGLTYAVAARRARRTRRRRHRSALAVASVAVITIGGTAAVRGVHRGDGVVPMTHGGPTVSAPPAPGGAAHDATLPHVRDVWPEAVSRIPKKAPDGFSYNLLAAFSPTEILLAADSSFEKAGRLEVYDTKAGTSRVLTEMVPGKKGYYEQDFKVGEDYVVWYGTTPNNRDEWADFWVAPIRGGAAVRVGEVTGALSDVETIDVTKDHVVWSVRSGGVYRMPITGGAAERIPGTDGMWLTSWPWAADAHDWRDRAKENANQSVLANLETGERRPVTAPAGVTGMRCVPQWCVGRLGDAVVAARPDGSGQVRLPGQMTRMTVNDGRFLLLRTPASIVYDLSTGTKAEIGARRSDGTPSSQMWDMSSSMSVIAWNAAAVSTEETCRPMTAEEKRSVAGVEPDPRSSTVCETRTITPGDDLEVLNFTAVPEAG